MKISDIIFDVCMCMRAGVYTCVRIISNLISKLYFQVLFVVCASLIGVTTSFLFDTNCVAPQPCTCSLNDINCYSKSLSQVPVFTEHNEERNAFYLRLYDNQLTYIPAYAFQNLSSINASSIIIYLYNNYINTIELHAFSGIANAVTYLDLRNNNLTHLPQALEELSSLNYLFLHGNPLLSLDSTIIASIGSTLNTLSISAGNFSRFPTQMNGLTKLSSLTINNIQLPLLHSTVFHSFENSLTSLEMSNSNFESIPAAVCRLRSLNSFTSNYSPNLSKYNASIFDECTHRMITVTSLTLMNNQLTVFPKLGTVFPNLRILDLRYNLLHLIESSSLMGLSALTTLYISNNQFNGIPSAINRARNLHTLYINSNQIDTVEDFDLLLLHNLTHIALNGNPLVYISPLVFSHAPLLSRVDLDYTKLGYIPPAILGLKRMQELNLRGKHIECSCNAMSYLKAWNVSTISTISATCSSGEAVKTFLTTELPKCT